MRRAVMTLALLFAVAGCGVAERPYRPQEVPPPPQADGTAAAEKERPVAGPETIRLGEGLRATIEWPADPDPLLKVMVDQYVGTRKALAAGATTYKHNLELDARIQANGWLQGFAERGETIRGLGRVYNLRVQAVVGKGAQINACIDETGIKVVSARTGKALARQPSWLRTPYAESVIARRGDDGVWRIRTYTDSDERCTR